VANDIKPPAFPGHGHTVRGTVAADRHAINAIAETHKPGSARNARREHLRELLPRDGAVLGIDLGDAKQALALVDHDMRVLWRRSPRCAAQQLGGPIGEAAGAAARAGMSQLTVACEPTGSRWMQVQRLCREAGVALVCVQPLVSHIAREQEDCTGHKRDEPDAVLVARLASELHCYVPEELDESWAFLRQLGRRRAQLVTAATAAVLRVRDFLSVAWPSAVTAAGDPFKSLTWLAALEVATSRCGGDPARLAAAGEEEFLALVRDAAPGWGTPRPDRRIARKVLALADDPGAVGWSRRGLFRRIRDEPGDLQRARRQLKEAGADMAALLAGLGLGRLGDIPGLTLAGAAVILAEAGDPAATRPLLPWSSTPGCRRRTTRRGHPRALRGSRGAAWRATFAMLNWNPVMKARYEALVAGAVS
jgi:hypothetical protein